MKNIEPDDFDHLVHKRPWVNDSFIGPSWRDLVLGYFVAKGEYKRAHEFADAYFKDLREDFVNETLPKV